jgi:hypothetical protein
MVAEVARCLEMPADQRLNPAQRPSLVLANPCASGPFCSSSSSSSRSHCCALSLSRNTGAFRPERLGVAVRKARCHRRTDPGVTVGCAISLIVSPRANRPAASSCSRYRHCCSVDVYPSVAHTACPVIRP